MAGRHEVHGRIGPNDISVADRDLFPHILGAQGMPKGPVWENRRVVTARESKGHRNLHAVRDIKLHAELRKPWNKSFGKEPLKDYEDSLFKNAAILVEQLHGLCEKGEVLIDGAKWLSYLSFDFMGDMVFGKSHNFLTEGDPNGVLGNDAREPYLSYRRPAHPLDPTSSTLPTLIFSQGRQRLPAVRGEAGKSKSTDRTFDEGLVLPPEVEPGTSVLPLIMTDAVLAIFAGSDTTATALSNVLYYLVRYPEWQEKVRREVDETQKSMGKKSGAFQVSDVEELANCRVLDAVLNETLRLQTPLPTLLQRAPAPGSGGKLLGDVFLPEGTTVQVPPYAVHRDPRHFYPRPKEFWPERWLVADPETTSILDRSAFIPFSMGPANCVGRPLALKQLRLVIAILLHNFEFRLPQDYEVDRWEREMKDRFLMVKGELPVLISRRDT
ncbi:hypothetical protein NMY22_g17093 [Coprinellus aureogranulatus]|nr:hypothetical protein NMY22_g17093 [Coprinellus aureogranulatus]